MSCTTVMAFPRSIKALEKGEITQRKKYVVKNITNPFNDKNDVECVFLFEKDIVADEYSCSVDCRVPYEYEKDKVNRFVYYSHKTISEIETFLAEFDFLDKQIKINPNISAVYLKGLDCTIGYSEKDKDYCLTSSYDKIHFSIPSGFVQFFSDVLDNYDKCLNDFKKSSVSLN